MLLKFLYIGTINEQKRNSGLDLVRGIAIFLILISHGCFFISFPPAKNLSHWNGGFFGVELFFVLSGFLIGGILIREFSNEYALPNISVLGRFWIRRWFRTLPNYFLFLVLSLTLFQWLFVPKDFDIRYFFFVQNFAWPIPNLMPESWSLATEEWFYFLFPLALSVFLFIPTSRKNSILIGIVVYLLFFTSIRFIEAFILDKFKWWDLRHMVVYRLDSVGYGVLLSFMNHYHGEFVTKHTKRLFVAGSIMLLFAVLIFSYSVLTTKQTLFNKTILFNLTNIGFALVLPMFMKIKFTSKRITYVVSHISAVSYSIYLIHFSFVVPFIFNYLPVAGIPWYLLYLLYIALSLVLATIVYKYYENPMTNLRDKFGSREMNIVHQVSIRQHK